MNVTDLSEEIKKTLEFLKQGKTILYPTDTVWGIGCDATNEEAVGNIFKLKSRSEKKAMIVLLDNENKLSQYLNEVPTLAYDLIEYAEKPLTIIYSGAKNLAKNLIAEDGSIGIRVVKHKFCKQLIEHFRKPIVSTSANLSNQPTPKQFQDIDQPILDGVDYIVKLTQEQAPTLPPSTIIKLEVNGRFTFIRR